MVYWRDRAQEILEAQGLLFRNMKLRPGERKRSATPVPARATPPLKKNPPSVLEFTKDQHVAIHQIAAWYFGQGYGDVRSFGAEGYTTPADVDEFKEVFSEWLFSLGWEAGKRGDAKPPSVEAKYTTLARKLGMNREMRKMLRGGWEDGKEAT